MLRISFLCLCLALAACGGKSKPAEPPKDNRTLFERLGGLDDRLRAVLVLGDDVGALVEQRRHRLRLLGRVAPAAGGDGDRRRVCGRQRECDDRIEERDLRGDAVVGRLRARHNDVLARPQRLDPRRLGVLRHLHQ